MLNSLRRDSLYALRSLVRSPGFSIVSILALALGIGANTAIFTVVNSVLLEPLHFYKPSQLVLVRERNLKAGFPQFSLSPGNYLDFRDHNRSFAGIAAFGGASMNFSAGGEPERLPGTKVTNDFFRILGASPILGRTFSEQENQLGNDRVVILSYGFWQRQFAGRRNILGQTVSLNLNPYTIIGVMPRDFQFPSRSQFWIPLTMNLQNWQQRGGHYLGGIGRLGEGVTLETAHTDLNSIAALAEKNYPASNAGWDTFLQSLQEASVGKVRPAILTLAAAVGFVLLIACVNLANLLLSRSVARRREIGIRGALGASRGTVIRQLLTESVILSGIGAMVGLSLAWLGTRLLVNLTPDILPRAAEIAVDSRVLAFTAAIAILTGILFGLAPSIQITQTDVSSALREGGRGNAIGFRRNRTRSILVVGEVALAIVLLSGAGLLIRSFYHLQGVDLGFDPHDVLTFRTNLPAARYKEAANTIEFYQRALQSIRALPAVTAAGAGQIFPLAGDDYILSFTQIGKPPLPAGSQPSAAYYAVTTGYFEALRIPLKAGRVFGAHDTASSPMVAVISDSMAQHFYKGENPLGQYLQVGNGTKPAEIVGVVGDVRDQELENPGRSAVYYSATQDPFGGMYFGVRTAGDPTALIAPIRAAIHSLDPELPLDAVGSVEGLVSKSLAQRRFAMLLMAVFASLAMILAMVGIYGVMAYSVTQATQEIGIRMALGAGRGDVLRMILSYGAVLTTAGLGIGAAAALGAGRLLTSQLYQVRPFDLITFTAVEGAVLAIGLAACILPALRAMRVDPVVALRND